MGDRIKPITLGFGVLADDLSVLMWEPASVLSDDCSSFLLCVHHYLLMFLYPQLEESFTTLQGHQW